MRGEEENQPQLLTPWQVEEAIPENHPLRPIRKMVDEALAKLSPKLDELYCDSGRPSIPPERLIRALVIQLLFSVRSERMLVEQLRYNLLFRWFVGLQLNEPVWNHSTFSKNRDRLIDGGVADAFFETILEQARLKRLLSSEHFTVDGTLLEAWASLKSFRPNDEDDQDPPSGSTGTGRNPKVDFRGKKRKNDTHHSRTDPEARLYTKGSGQAAKLCFMGHLVTENRNGLVVGAKATQATGHAEREAALELLAKSPRSRRATVGADKAYDTRDFVSGLRAQGVTPHLAQNTSKRSSAIDHRTTRYEGYATSQRRRKIVEEAFGWIKTVAGLRKLRHRGRRAVDWMFTLAAATYNLVRMRNLVPEPT